MTDPRNPYTPPTAHVGDPVDPIGADSHETFIPDGRRVPGGRGAAWIGDAWQLLRARPGKWALAMLLLLLFYIVASLIPLSSLITPFLWPFVAAGIVMAADTQRRTGTFEVATLFGGVHKQPMSLLAIGAMFLLTVVALFVSLAILVGTGPARQAVFDTGRPDPSLMLSANYMLALLVYLALAIPITAATYLAAPLIVLHDLPAGTAMRMSLVGSFKNILSGLVFSLCAILLVIVSIIPLGLGLLISIPIMILTNYTMYRDIFIERSEA
ncbi:MAG: BPSS1780 family membrane protein [Gammaproteobacteria bacterium]